MSDEQARIRSHYPSMLKHLVCLIALAFLLACEGNTAARKAARGPNFVSDPDHIYFKNTRARNYRAEEIAERATIYRHDKLFNSAARLRPTLIDNWLQDRAIIRFEVDSLSKWKLLHGVSAEAVPIPLSTPPTNSELATFSRYLLGTEPLWLVAGPDTLAAYPEREGRTEARLVITDFLRMVAYQP